MMSGYQLETSRRKGEGGPNPLPAANSRRRICYRWLPEIRYSWASPGLGSPAAVAEGGRSAELHFATIRQVDPPGLE